MNLARNRARPVGRMEPAGPRRPTPDAGRAPKPGFTDPDPVFDRDWRSRAACREVDPELHQPIGESGPALLQVEDAKAVCRGCPVEARCLAWALETNQGFGVWGATTPSERRALKRREARQRQGAKA